MKSIVLVFVVGCIILTTSTNLGLKQQQSLFQAQGINGGLPLLEGGFIDFTKNSAEFGARQL